MELKKIYEDTYLTIYEDTKGWDFHYNIKNNLADLSSPPNDITIHYGDTFEETLKVNDWIGLFNDQDYIVDYIKEGKYFITF